MSIPSSSLRPAVADWAQLLPIGPRADDPAGTRRSGLLANVEHRLLDRLPIVLAEIDDLPTMFTLALAEICRATGWRLGEAWAPRDPGTGPLQRVARWASALPDRVESETVSRELSFARGVGLPGRVWAAMRPIWLDDVSACPWYQRSIPTYRAGFRTALGIPVSFRGRLVAVFVVYADGVRPREDDLVRLLSNAAGPIGAVLAGQQPLQRAERLRRERPRPADTTAEGVVTVGAKEMIHEAGRLLDPDAAELDGEARFLGIANDITDRKRMERELGELALRDTLTGLPNRNLFEDRLAHAFESNRRPGSMAVMFIDLDRFKVVNDSLGHSVGDELLVAVADRLRSCCRRQDTIARVGGDEFGVVLEYLESPDEATEISHRMIETFESRFDIDGKSLHVTPSIGVAFGSDDIERASDLLRYADVAMYRTKEEGGAGCNVFDPKLDLSATRRLDREAALRKAIDERELIVRYQPVISCRTGRIVGAEELVAWQHPEKGLISPEKFIPLAEETGLIVPLGRFVLRHAAEMVERWRPMASPECPFRVSVNVSPRQMRCSDFLMDVRDVLRESGTPPSAIVLELTEGVLIRNTEMAAALRDLGVSIAVDDLGTGYASLEYLTRLEFDLLKLDRIFTSGLGLDPSKTAIVESMLLLADRLGVPLVAEGIETAEQLRLLRGFRCDYGQGFHIAQSMPAEAFERLLQEGPRW